MKPFSLSALISALLLAPPALSADTLPDVGQAGSGLLQVLLSLAVVIGLLWGSLYLLRHLQAARANPAGGLKVIAATAVGQRERVVVVEIGDQWLVVGVAPGRVNALTTLPRQASPDISIASRKEPTKEFSAWLKQMMERK